MESAEDSLGDTLNLDGGTLTLHRGTRPPAFPLQFKYWFYCNCEQFDLLLLICWRYDLRSTILIVEAKRIWHHLARCSLHLPLNKDSPHHLCALFGFFCNYSSLNNWKLLVIDLRSHLDLPCKYKILNTLQKSKILHLLRNIFFKLQIWVARYFETVLDVFKKLFKQLFLL